MSLYTWLWHAAVFVSSMQCSFCWDCSCWSIGSKKLASLPLEQCRSFCYRTFGVASGLWLVEWRTHVLALPVALVCISSCFHARVRMGGCVCIPGCTWGDFQSQDFLCCHCHTFAFLYISEFFILKGWAKAPSVCIWSQASLLKCLQSYVNKSAAVHVCARAQPSFLHSRGAASAEEAVSLNFSEF